MLILPGTCNLSDSDHTVYTNDTWLDPSWVACSPGERLLQAQQVTRVFSLWIFDNFMVATTSWAFQVSFHWLATLVFTTDSNKQKVVGEDHFLKFPLLSMVECFQVEVPEILGVIIHRYISLLQVSRTIPSPVKYSWHTALLCETQILQKMVRYMYMLGWKPLAPLLSSHPLTECSETQPAKQRVLSLQEQLSEWHNNNYD